MQLSDVIAVGEAEALRKGWFLTRKCDGWETSATYGNSSRMRFKGSRTKERQDSGKVKGFLKMFPCLKRTLWYVEVL